MGRAGGCLQLLSYFYSRYIAMQDIVKAIFNISLLLSLRAKSVLRQQIVVIYLFSLLLVLALFLHVSLCLPLPLSSFMCHV